MAEERGLRQGELRRFASGSRLHLHIAVSAVLFFLTLAGWGAFAQAVFARRQQETESKRDVTRLSAEVSRLSADRDRVLQQQRALEAELAQSKADLAAAQRGISGLIAALERSRAELSAQPTDSVRKRN